MCARRPLSAICFRHYVARFVCLWRNAVKYHHHQIAFAAGAAAARTNNTVAPRMLERRELLMPQMRSFSELELSANPTNKLRLVCLAQCEPLCSIEWYLNQEPAAAAAARSEPSAAANKLGQLAAQTNQTMTRVKLVAAEANGFVQKQELFAAGLPWLRLTSVENVLQRDLPMTPSQGHTADATASRFGWLRQSSLNGGQAPITQQQEQLDWLGRQLMREAAERQYSPDQVNVFSRLALSYNAIARLLDQQQHQRDADSLNSEHMVSATKIGCRVNPMFDSSGGLEHQFVAPNHWFSPPPDVGSGKRARTNLSSLFAPTAAPSDDDVDNDEEQRQKVYSFVDELQISLLLDSKC